MTSKLEPNRMYHIFNRGNNRENLFREERNYEYFLRLYVKYISPIANTYAYCLMPNHFHFLVKIKEASSRNANPTQQFSNLFNSYAKSINKAYYRTGALFHRPFGRNEVKSDSYYTHLVYYIHVNPLKHGFTKDFRTYPFSSYRVLLSDEPSIQAKHEVMSWFGGKENFIDAHNKAASGLLSIELFGED
jgi:putative transposase